MANTITRMLTRKNTPPPPAPFASERDRLAAEIQYEKDGLPELALLVRLGRRDAAELERAERRVEALEGHLATLNVAAAAESDLNTRREQILPARMEALKSQLREESRLLDELTRLQEALEREATELQSDFQLQAGPHFELLQLARSLNFATQRGGLRFMVNRWMQIARRVGVFGEPEPEPQPYVDPKSLMSQAELVKLQDDDRQRRRMRLR
jgi:hypothetical protein